MPVPLRFGPPLEQHFEAGKRLRKKVPRREQALWQPASGRPDVVDHIIAANGGRLPHLLPIKYGRMAASPFGFFRGAAPLMAADLASQPYTGVNVQICGDAHVRNLGAYAAPDGHLVFDINDFDETLRGPWEWDLKRFATSIVLAGREAGNGDDGCTDAIGRFVHSYRTFLYKFSEMKVLDLAKFEISRRYVRGPVSEIMEKAARATAEANLEKLTAGRNGRRRFRRQPPLLTPVNSATATRVIKSLTEYRNSLGSDHQVVIDAYRPVDVSFKVVGTGSVASKDYVVLCFGHGVHDPIFLQVKQEWPSCYAPYLSDPGCGHEGKRVAEGQHRMQTVSDPLLGWTSMGNEHYLVRQLRDHKASINPEELTGETLEEYSAIAGEVLAKAHARTSNSAALAGYCGGNDRLDKAIRKFAVAYAEQTDRDYERFVKAIRTGKIKAHRNV